MKMKLLIHFTLACTLMYLFSSCSLEKMGASAGKGVSSETDSMGARLVRGAMTELTDPQTQKKIRQFLDSIIASAMDTLNYKTVAMRDSLINQKIINLGRFYCRSRYWQSAQVEYGKNPAWR